MASRDLPRPLNFETRKLQELDQRWQAVEDQLQEHRIQLCEHEDARIEQEKEMQAFIDNLNGWQCKVEQMLQERIESSMRNSPI